MNFNACGSRPERLGEIQKRRVVTLAGIFRAKDRRRAVAGGFSSDRHCLLVGKGIEASRAGPRRRAALRPVAQSDVMIGCIGIEQTPVSFSAQSLMGQRSVTRSIRPALVRFWNTASGGDNKPGGNSFATADRKKNWMFFGSEDAGGATVVYTLIETAGCTGGAYEYSGPLDRLLGRQPNGRADAAQVEKARRPSSASRLIAFGR